MDSANQREVEAHGPYSSEGSWTVMCADPGLSGIPGHLPPPPSDGRWAQELLNSPLAQVVL